MSALIASGIKWTALGKRGAKWAFPLAVSIPWEGERATPDDDAEVRAMIADYLKWLISSRAEPVTFDYRFSEAE